MNQYGPLLPYQSFNAAVHADNGVQTVLIGLEGVTLVPSETVTIHDNWNDRVTYFGCQGASYTYRCYANIYKNGEIVLCLSNDY